MGRFILYPSSSHCSVLYAVLDFVTIAAHVTSSGPGRDNVTCTSACWDPTAVFGELAFGTWLFGIFWEFRSMTSLELLGGSGFSSRFPAQGRWSFGFCTAVSRGSGQRRLLLRSCLCACIFRRWAKNLHDACREDNRTCHLTSAANQLQVRGTELPLQTPSPER